MEGNVVTELVSQASYLNLRSFYRKHLKGNPCPDTTLALLEMELFEEATRAPGDDPKDHLFRAIGYSSLRMGQECLNELAQIKTHPNEMSSLLNIVMLMQYSQNQELLESALSTLAQEFGDGLYSKFPRVCSGEFPLETIGVRGLETILKNDIAGIAFSCLSFRPSPTYEELLVIKEVADELPKCRLPFAIWLDSLGFSEQSYQMWSANKVQLSCLPSMWWLMASYHMRNKKFKAAVRACKNALSISPGLPHVVARMALCQAELGQLSKARQTLMMCHSSIDMLKEFPYLKKVIG